MTIEKDFQGNALIIALAGRICEESAEALGALLAREIAAGNRHLALDLSKVEQLCLSGLWELMTACKRARRNGGDLRLAQPSDPARAALEAARLNEIISVYDKLADAVASF